MPDLEHASQEAAFELRVQERTSEIVSALKELESFNSSISHDLRAPLRAIRGYASVLIEEHGRALPPGARDLVDRIAAATNRIYALSDGLLALAKSGQVKLQRTQVNLSDLADAILADLHHTYPARDVVVSIEPFVLADADSALIASVLQNLLGNAWKYSSKCESTWIAFRCCSREPEPVYAVSDNGAGFDMTRAGRLFESFERLHSMAEFEGTGLGLATVRRIVERHGGRIWFDSRVGQGATFYFTLGERGTVRSGGESNLQSAGTPLGQMA